MRGGGGERATLGAEFEWTRFVSLLLLLLSYYACFFVPFWWAPT